MQIFKILYIYFVISLIGCNCFGMNRPISLPDESSKEYAKVNELIGRGANKRFVRRVLDFEFQKNHIENEGKYDPSYVTSLFLTYGKFYTPEKAIADMNSTLKEMKKNFTPLDRELYEEYKKLKTIEKQYEFLHSL